MQKVKIYLVYEVHKSSTVSGVGVLHEFSQQVKIVSILTELSTLTFHMNEFQQRKDLFLNFTITYSMNK